MTKGIDTHDLPERITKRHAALTPKSRILGDYIKTHPRKAVFMTVAELARACDVSEATVVRFVGQLGYGGYGEFQQALRDFVDTGLTLLERVDLIDMGEPGSERFQRVVSEEIDALRQLFQHADMERINRVVSLLQGSDQICVIGSRLSYSLAYCLGWSLTKIRGGIQILKGSDRTAIDWLTISPPKMLVIIITMSRYPQRTDPPGQAGQTPRPAPGGDDRLGGLPHYPRGRRKSRGPVRPYPPGGVSHGTVLPDQLHGSGTGKPIWSRPEKAPGKTRTGLLGKRRAF